MSDLVGDSATRRWDISFYTKALKWAGLNDIFINKIIIISIKNLFNKSKIIFMNIFYLILRYSNWSNSQYIIICSTKNHIQRISSSEARAGRLDYDSILTWAGVDYSVPSTLVSTGGTVSDTSSFYSYCGTFIADSWAKSSSFFTSFSTASYGYSKDLEIYGTGTSTDSIIGAINYSFFS